MLKLPAKKINGLLLRFFSKAAFTGVFSNYNSYIFDTYKIALVYTRSFSNFFNVFSSLKNFHVEVSHLRSIFKYYNYPVNVIDLCIKKMLDTLYVPKEIVPTVPKRELLVALPLFFL